MKNVKKFLLMTAFATLLGVGAFAGFSSAKDSQVKEARAESWNQNPTVYFVPHDQWVMEGNERFKMNYYNGESYSGSVEMSYYGTSAVKGPYYNRKVYKGTVTDGSYVSRVQFLRMDSNFSQLNYSGVIYLTDNNGSPVLMTNHELDYWNNFTTETSGVWFTSLVQHAVYKTTDQSPSSLTGRVFFYNSGTHWSSASGCAVYAWGGSASPTIWNGHSEVADASIYNFSWFTDDNGASYGYADIPLDIEGYKICTISDVDSYHTAPGYFSSNQFNIDSFAYVRYGQSEGNYIDSGAAHDSTAGVNLMKKVIEAYDTCSSSALNGYGAYGALNTNFYSKATAAAKSATHTSLGGQSRSIQVHFEAMAARSSGKTYVGAAILESNTNASNGTMAAVIAASFAAIAAAGFLFFKKKRFTK